ncbi:MAG: type II toxin-antitoxin system RelE/ParE family toxin [Flavobacteriales bacterium]
MGVVWSKRSVTNLKKIRDFYIKSLKTVTGANSIIKGIKQTGDALTPNILHQTEENLKLDQYRVIYKHFKIVYKVRGGEVWVLQVFDARQDPRKLKS